MAVTETYTASLYSRTYDGTINRDGYATHGTWEGNNWVGMILLPASLLGKKVTAITFNVTANTAGTTATKTVNFYSSNHQSPTTSGTGSIFPNSRLFFVKAPFRNTSISFNLVDSNLTNVANYLSTGGQMLVLYDPTSDEDNYCRFTSISITVTYEDVATGPKGTIMYKVDGRWQECEVYLRRYGSYHKYIPCIKKDGTWRECSSS